MAGLLNKRNVLLLLTFLFFLIAWNRAINLLYGMFALLAATLVLACLLPRFSLRSVSAVRSLPATAFEGDRIEIAVSVRNNGLAGRSLIEIVDLFPAADPGSRSPMTFVAKLPGRKSRSYAFRLPCYKRGEYRIGPLSLSSSYPLGIWTATRELSGSIVPLLVYPAVFDIAALPLFSGGTAPMSGIEAASKAGGGEEFFGTREYRRGDSLRHIHWPSTARHAHLIVKEFEIRSSVEVTIMLDLHKDSDIGTGRETTLEYAVKIAASAAKYALERGHTVQFAAYGAREHLVPAARGLSQFALILEELARVTADGTISIPAAINRASDLMREGGTAILIFADSYLQGSDAYSSFDLLRAKRIRPVCVVLDRASFSERPSGDRSGAHRRLIAEGVACYPVSRGDALTEVFAG